MEWWPTALLLLGGLVVLGVVLAMRIRRDRSTGTEGPDVWEPDEVRDAQRRRDEPDVREWDRGTH
ncbi:hypothetical protein [Agromyces humi]|uniref:hypothetical protein n=1 Tax=Agromyces humi TaxID=1766800 RepID=UPI001357CC25|nr:hypothetical protein [Agromyces humi]